MNEFRLHLEPVLSAGIAGMGRVLWQGTLAITIVWLGCRALPRLSPRLQHWLWRLVYLKLAFCLFWTVPIDLPLLPQAGLRPMSEHGSLPAPAGGPSVTLPAPAQPTATSTGGAANQRVPAPPASPAAILFGFWLLGAGAHVLWLVRDYRRLARLRARAYPAEAADLLALRDAACRCLGIRRVPDLLLSEEASTPMLVGIRRPAVVLPVSLQVGCSDAQLQLILAHELTHLKRRDLLWAWLPNLARVLFCFHPLLWLAEREWRLTAEMACDEEVLLADPTARARYGELLLFIAAPPPLNQRATPLTAGMTESYPALHRRLTTIKKCRSLSHGHLLRGGVVLAALAAPLLLPWRVCALPGTAPKPGTAPQPAATRAEQEEDRLLLQAMRYLRLAPSQLQQIRPLAQTAEDRLQKLEQEEVALDAALERTIEKQRQALAEGRSFFQQIQDWLALDKTRRQKRQQAAAEITALNAPKLSLILAPDQVRRAFLLAYGESPRNALARPALLDPESGFVQARDAQMQRDQEAARWARVRPYPARMASYIVLAVDAGGYQPPALELLPTGESGPPFPARWDENAAPELGAAVLRPLVRRMFTSPRLGPVLEERLRRGAGAELE